MWNQKDKLGVLHLFTSTTTHVLLDFFCLYRSFFILPVLGNFGLLIEEGKRFCSSMVHEVHRAFRAGFF